jgi:hypothetical protein
LPARALERLGACALVGGWVLHAVLLVIDIAGWAAASPARAWASGRCCRSPCGW